MRNNQLPDIFIIPVLVGVFVLFARFAFGVPWETIGLIAGGIVFIGFFRAIYTLSKDAGKQGFSLNKIRERFNELEHSKEKKEVPQGRYKSSDMMPFGQTLPFEIKRPGTKYRKTKTDWVDVGDYVSVGDFHFAGDEIRWLGDRQGRGEVILDIEKDGWWYTLTIEAGTSADDLVDALKQITPERVATARNMRKPNIRSETIEGYVNQQNLQGQWQRQDVISLTITPLYLVILSNGSIFEAIRLEQILNVHCIEHPMALDESALLLSFETQVGSRQAYEITDKTFCDRLATASRESVNQEPQRKKKQQQ